MSEVGGIEVEADLRAHWTGVRDQGARPTCLACAASDAHAHAHALAHPLSVEYVFFKAAQQMPGKATPSGLTLDATAAALRADGHRPSCALSRQVAHPAMLLADRMTARHGVEKRISAVSSAGTMGTRASAAGIAGAWEGRSAKLRAVPRRPRRSERRKSRA